MLSVLSIAAGLPSPSSKFRAKNNAMIPQFIEKRVFFPFVPYKLSQLEESDHQRYQWKPLQIQAHSKIQKG